jgi:hypothetical protein
MSEGAPRLPRMTTQSSTRAELVLGPAHGTQSVMVPLRPDGLPVRIFRLELNGEVIPYLRRHRAAERDWVYVYEPDAK